MQEYNITNNDYINLYVTETLIKKNVPEDYRNIILKTLVSLNYRLRLDIDGIIKELNIIRKIYRTKQLSKQLSEHSSKQPLDDDCDCN